MLNPSSGMALLPMLMRQHAAPWARTCIRSFAASKAEELALIKQLRDRSGAPLGEVRQCLADAQWDLEAAFDALRKKGVAAAAKKSGRHAAEGLVGVAASGAGRAAVVEVNSETDFVARMGAFQELVREVAAAAATLDASAVDPVTGEVQLDALAQASTSRGATVAQACTSLAAEVRENVRLRRAYCITSPGVISSYLHNSEAPGTGRIAGLLALESSAARDAAAAEKLSSLGSDLAMHAVGMRAMYLTRDEVPADVLEREKDVLRQQALGSGKPAQVVEKILQGRLMKFYEEVCLLDQRFLLVPEVKVADLLKRTSKVLGADVRIGKYIRLQVGEGLHKAEDKDFASQVSEMVQGSS